jgi:hypothetical protein
LSGALYQYRQDLKRLADQLDPGPVFPQLVGVKVRLVVTELEPF